MDFISNYMSDMPLRHALNRLTRKTFGFDFEDWVSNGYFNGDYIPYSLTEQGKILSNVSANRMHFMQNGVPKYYIQVGTVMTDEAYRHQGLAKKLLEHVLREYEDKCHGIYLFANLQALDFYRKAGFQEGLQYQYTLKADRKIPQKRTGLFQPVDTQDRQVKLHYMDTVQKSAVNASLDQINKFGLQMFYTADLSGLYYSRDLNCYAAAEMQEHTLILKSVISREHLSLADLLPRMGIAYRKLKLGFSPCAEDADLFEASVYDGEDDYRLFFRGRELERIEKDKLFFPLLSHA